MDRIAIIPARGGSKRIPRKNIKSFLGKPIIAYSIEAAIQSDLFSEVMVSTDDLEIASIAKKFGAKVPFLRSTRNANDHATTFDVIEEVLKTYSDKGQNFQQGCCLYPTAPFTSGERLVKFHKFLEEKDFDCVFPVLKYGHPIQRSLKLDNNKGMSMIYPEHIETRTQDLEPSFHDAGQFYWFNTRRLIDFGKLWTKNTGCLEIDESLAHDIDHLEDWKIAEYKYSLMTIK